MPDEELTDKLLTDYEATAENLQHQVNVSQETMNRYHGMTGMLLAQCVRSLWSQRELDDQIDKRMEEHCKNCRNRVAQSWLELVKLNFRLIVICVAVIVSALATRKLPDLGTLVKAVVPAVESAESGE